MSTEGVRRVAADRPAVAPSRSRANVRRGVRRVAIIALLIIGPLLAAEIGLRLLVAFDRLPFAVAHSDQFEITWTNLHRRDDWEVLLLGDSTTQQGINPAIIGEVMGAELGREVHAFDGAVPGSKLLLNLAIAHQLVDEDRLPPVVVVGIQPGLLGGNQEFKDFFLKTPMGRIATDCAYEGSYNDIVSCRAEELSMLWRMRGRYRAIIEAIYRPMPTQLRGRGSRPSMLGPDGYRTSSGTTEDALLQELDKRERTGQLTNFNLKSESIDNFTELVNYLRANGSTVIAVCIPNTPPLADRLEALYPGWAERFDAGLDELEVAADIEIARPQIADWFKASDAHNVKHLSADGAARFTTELLEIGWLRTAIAEGLDGSAVGTSRQGR